MHLLALFCARARWFDTTMLIETTRLRVICVVRWTTVLQIVHRDTGRRFLTKDNQLFHIQVILICHHGRGEDMDLIIAAAISSEDREAT